MTFIPITVLSRDEMDGKTVYVRPETIVSVAPIEFRKDDLHLIGISKITHGSMLWFSNGKPQTVSETPEQIIALVDNDNKMLLEKYSGL
jgi:hypothetical protein